MALSPKEVAHFLEAIPSVKHRAVLMTAYAAGLRISEATRLTVSDIDSQCCNSLLLLVVFTETLM
ncbi:tyrosine-type recombinase/integrase [Caballeronia novacaledonica]|uniref:tyrosine-type recombinase/integrase n=1 Tax=Caballeronia novacaledonica TaxID=1544861 RepID=UPI001EE351A9|nr:tyrosine-type recombinase/integrase [Caballeronia novacaledonica]